MAIPQLGDLEISDLEEGLITLVSELGELSYEDDYLQLVKLLHRPVQMTPTELMLIRAVVESMLAQTRILVGLKESLVAGSRQSIGDPC